MKKGGVGLMKDDVAMVTNGNFDPIAQWARLSERVENQGKDIVDLRSNMNTGFQNIQSGLSALSNELRGSSRTQWPVIFSAAGVALSVIIAVGTLTILPIRESISNITADLKTLTSSTVSRDEMDWRTARSQEDRIRTETAMNDFRSNLVPRPELDRVFASNDQRFVDLQRQIDEAKSAFGGTYSLRDYIQRLTDRLDQLERRQLQEPTP